MKINLDGFIFREKGSHEVVSFHGQSKSLSKDRLKSRKLFLSMKARRSSKSIMKRKIYCDDQSSLSSTTAVQYEFHVYFTSFQCTGRCEINKLTWLNFLGPWQFTLWVRHAPIRRNVRTKWKSYLTEISNILHSHIPVFILDSWFFKELTRFTKLTVKSDHRSKFSNLSNWKEEAWKYQGFNGIRTRDLGDTSAMLDHVSCEATHSERGQLLSLYLPLQWNDVKCLWNSYYIAVVDESEEWSSQCVASQLSWSSIAPVSRIEVTGSNPFEALIFFRLFPSKCLWNEKLRYWKIK